MTTEWTKGVNLKQSCFQPGLATLKYYDGHCLCPACLQKTMQMSQVAMHRIFSVILPSAANPEVKKCPASPLYQQTENPVFLDDKLLPLFLQ